MTVEILCDINDHTKTVRCSFNEVFDPRVNKFVDPDMTLETFLKWTGKFYSKDNYLNNRHDYGDTYGSELVDKFFEHFPDKAHLLPFFHQGPYYWTGYVPQTMGTICDAAHDIGGASFKEMMENALKLIEERLALRLGEPIRNNIGLFPVSLPALMSSGKAYLLSEGGRTLTGAQVMAMSSDFRVHLDDLTYDLPVVDIVYDYSKDKSPLYKLFGYSTNPMKYLGRKYISKQKRGKKEFPRGDDKRLVGVELEICTDMGIKDLIDAADRPFFICKEDSSISGAGMTRAELVTLPMDMRAQRIAWGKFFSRFWDKEQKTYPKFDTSTLTANGMHVHLSLSGFSEKHLQKFVWFHCDPLNREFLTFVSERGRKLDKFCDMPDTRGATRKQFYKRCINAVKNMPNRGVVSIRGHSKPTIEVRLFKGVFSYATVLKNLEFVDAVYHFTQDNPYCRITVSGFLSWLRDQPKQKYKALRKFLTEMPKEMAEENEVNLRLTSIDSIDKVIPFVERRQIKVNQALLVALNKRFSVRKSRPFGIKNGKLVLKDETKGRLAKHEADFLFREAA